MSEDDEWAGVVELKATLRADGRGARRGVGVAARRQAARSVAGHLARLVPPEVLALGYAATPEELPLRPWLTRRLAEGGRLALPRVRGRELEVVEIHDLTADLVPGYRGIAEPSGPACAPGSLGALVVPGTAFDGRGGRLGQGGGHVDRLLARVDGAATSIGVCFAVQLVDAVPSEPHDHTVDIVLTERGVAADRR